MLLFVCDGKNDILEVLDGESLEKVGEVGCFGEKESVGINSGCVFNGMPIFLGRHDDTVRAVDAEKMAESEIIKVGAYPVFAASDEKSMYVACGDSNSIWTINENFEVTFIDTTVKFPFCMAQSRDYLCVCGHVDGEVVIYEKNSFKIKTRYNIRGNPYGVAYFIDKPAICYNGEYGDGLILYDGAVIKLGSSISKLIAAQNFLFACVDEKNIFILNKALETKAVIRTDENISDFVVGEKRIYVSFTFENIILVFDFEGNVLLKGSAKDAGGTLLLLP